MAQITRQPGVSLTWAERNVTQDLAPYLEELTFTDSLKSGEGQHDEISLVLDNHDGRFLDTWWPSSGDLLQPAITWKDSAGAHSWGLGTFAVDGIKIRRAPATLAVKALSQAIQRTALEQKENRVWEKVSLSEVVAEVGNRAGLRTQFDAADALLEPLYQRHESANQLLARLAKRFNAQYAIKGGVLLFQDAGENVGKHTGKVIALSWLNDIVGGDFNVKSRTAYAKVTLEYYDAAKDQLLTHTETDPAVAGGRTLKLYDQAANLAEAQKLARAALKQKNKGKGGTGNLAIPGQPIWAGSQIKLGDAAKLDGLWQVRQAIHSVKPNNGWTTRLALESPDARQPF